MNEGLIPRRYAKALLKLAVEKGEDKRIYELMRTLTSSFEAQSELSVMTSNPFVSFADKEKLLMTAAGASADDVLYSDFLRLLDKNKRMPALRESALAYVDLYRKMYKIYKVDVTAAAPMDNAEQDRLKKLIVPHLHGGTMEYSFNVDPSLIGGFTVTIDSERLDASVANEFKQMRQKLL